jgi:transcriptional regulator with XRE-family HTH domain
MPRRSSPDPLAAAVGRRVRQLREEAGLTLEGLAFESDAPRGKKGFSKGHLSSLEKGLVMPTVATLKVLADRLGVLVADLVTVPEDGDREHIIDATRKLPKGVLKKLARDLGEKKPSRVR